MDDHGGGGCPAVGNGVSCIMPPKIIFVPSAFKHGVNETEDRWAFMRPRYDGPLEGMENKYIRIGFDPHGNLLEIFYNEIGDNRGTCKTSVLQVQPLKPQFCKALA